MAKFLSHSGLYGTIQQKSFEAKDILWVCSPYLSTNAHAIFSQEILKSPPKDIRFIFRLNDDAVERGEVDPYEIQYFMEHFKGSCIRSHETFHSNIYIFDNSALITSANLTRISIEKNIEAGVLLDGSSADEVKNFFHQSLWQTAKPINDVKKFKKIWGNANKNANKDGSKKIKSHTTIKQWTDDYVDKWYFVIPEQMTKKTKRRIYNEANWSNRLSLIGDIGPNSFRHIKLGDLTFIASLSKKRGKVEIELARIFDKNRVETDEGDLHFAYEPKNNYELDRCLFYEILKNINISSKTSEIILNQSQVEYLENALASIKHKRRPRT